MNWGTDKIIEWKIVDRLRNKQTDTGCNHQDIYISYLSFTSDCDDDIIFHKWRIQVCVTGTDVSLIKLLFLLSPVQPKSGHWKMSPVWWRTWGMYQTQICEICYIVDRFQFTKVFHQIEMLNVASCLQVGAVIQFLNCGVIKYLFSMAHHTALDG